MHRAVGSGKEYRLSRCAVANVQSAPARLGLLFDSDERNTATIGRDDGRGTEA
jgi:hypothetical protein